MTGLRNSAAFARPALSLEMLQVAGGGAALTSLAVQEDWRGDRGDVNMLITRPLRTIAEQARRRRRTQAEIALARPKCDGIIDTAAFRMSVGFLS
jgi:hypothetical protein